MATFHRWGRALSLTALLPILLFRSAAGESLVLHQHGVRGAHLHFLDDCELSSGAAGSPQFGHGESPTPPSLIVLEDVRILLVVSIGSIVVITPQSTSDESNELSVSIDWSPLSVAASIVEFQGYPASLLLALGVPPKVGHAAVSGIVLRNHALLV
ncbi:MAG: hypothetical protein HY287_07225 [Planctomycetes bacterium]|nr:hypothetical protein [Planctomycetota bacterium]